MKSMYKKLLCISIGISFVILPCGGCSGPNGDNVRIKGSTVYGAAVCGGLIGGIIGHQSDDTGEGVAIGAALFGVGALLAEIDSQTHPKTKDSPDNKARKSKEENIREIYIIEIHNSNGSVTPVKIRKKGDIYIGPNNEQYNELPTEEQHKPVYGL